MVALGAADRPDAVRILQLRQQIDAVPPGSARRAEIRRLIAATPHNLPWSHAFLERRLRVEEERGGAAPPSGGVPPASAGPSTEAAPPSGGVSPDLFVGSLPMEVEGWGETKKLLLAEALAAIASNLGLDRGLDAEALLRRAADDRGIALVGADLRDRVHHCCHDLGIETGWTFEDMSPMERMRQKHPEAFQELEKMKEDSGGAVPKQKLEELCGRYPHVEMGLINAVAKGRR